MHQLHKSLSKRIKYKSQYSKEIRKIFFFLRNGVHVNFVFVFVNSFLKIDFFLSLTNIYQGIKHLKMLIQSHISIQDGCFKYTVE